jgi:hypothetical protein
MTSELVPPYLATLARNNAAMDTSSLFRIDNMVAVVTGGGTGTATLSFTTTTTTSTDFFEVLAS